MKKFLLAFLSLLMLTPSLVCAMPACVDNAQRAGAVSMPCDHHGVQAHHSESDGKIGTVGLMKDCMGVDFQVADTVSVLKKLEFKKDFSFEAANSILLADAIVLDGTKGNRGPPDWPGLFNATSPSIILSTQRRLI